MLALSIRQPYAEEILRGIKKIEYRSRRVSDAVMRERFYIYAAKQPAEGAGVAKRFAALGSVPGGLPTGVIVGSAIISRCSRLTTNNSQLTTLYEWHLTGVKRLKRSLKPTGMPQAVWFNPFDQAPFGSEPQGRRPGGPF